MIWRIRLLSGIFLFLFFLIIVRLFYWQVVRGSELSTLGSRQYTSVVKLDAIRGQIRASDNFPLASQKLVFLLFVDPKLVEDKKKTAKILSEFLEMEEATLSALLNKDLRWVQIKGKVPNEIKEKVEKLELSGVGFERQDSRFYPEASMAAHLLGIVAKDEAGKDLGYFGLEGYYDRQLRGRGGEERELIDVFGRPILVKNPFREEKIDGRSLVLHVDRTVQFIVEEKLKLGIEKFGAKGGTVVVMDPKTGGILASASIPTYDPSHFEEFGESFFKNPLVSETYEPGSVFKPLVMSAALNESLVKPDTICTQCQGPVTIGDYTIQTWNNKYYKDTTMAEVIEHSDNTGMVFVSQKLGLEKLLSYLKAFGLGEITEIDLQEESAIPLREKDTWYPIDLATASFGQGVAVTPIQMLNAISAIANGGTLMEPHVVAKIVESNGKEIAIPSKVVREVISQQTAAEMSEMMVKAVDLGEAKFAKPKGYRIAGKTGTAQIPIAGHYDPNKTVASFVGFAPVPDPRFVMLVKLNEPTSSPFGSETAAPLFFSIAKDLLVYYGIAPSE